jgi:O-antigen ligase
MAERLDKIIAIGLAVAIVFTALAHGAVEPWSVAIFELITISLLALWAAKMVIAGRVEISVPQAALPVAGLFALGLVQSVAFASGSGRRVSLSMDVDATRGAITVLFFLLACFIIGANFFRTRERLRALANFLIIYGLAMAVFALLQHFTWEGRFFWFKETTRTVFGSFVNRNHFAGYMEMLVPIPIALIVSRGARRELWLLYGFAAALMGVAILVSLSRGGMIGLVAGLMFILFMSARMPSFRLLERYVSKRVLALWMRAGAVAVVSVAIISGIIWLGAEPLIARVAESVNELQSEAVSPYSRVSMWKDAWAIFLARPVAGIGLGAFETVYPIYGHSDGSLIVDYAHNDYMQILSDAGVIGAALGLWFIVGVFRGMLKGIASRDPLVSGLALGCGAGACSILAHSLFDFNLQIPSNALLFLILISVVSCTGAISTRHRLQKPAHPFRELARADAASAGEIL